MSGALRALVLGATGHVGQAVVRELLARGHAVTAATRQARPASLADLAVTVAPGDADRAGQFDAWVRGHDVVLDAAAPYPMNLFVADGPAERAPLAYARARTRRLLDAVARHGAALGYVDSFTTLPRNDTGAAALEARWRRRLHPYFGVKAEMEALVRAAAREGLRAVVVNPTACLGPWDPKLAARSLVALLLARAVPAVSGRVVNVIDVRDVARGLCAAVEMGGTPRAEPIALAGHDVAADALARRVCALGGVAPPPWRASARLGAVASLWAEAAWAAAGRASPMPALAALLLCDSGPRAVGAAQRALGVAPRPLDDTLRDAVAWHRRSAGGRD